MDDFVTYSVVIVTALFLASETLAQIPAIKANSVFQVIHNVLGKLYGLFGKKQTNVEENKKEN